MEPWFIIPMTVLLIPISAIVLGIGSGIIKTICQSQERKLQMKLAARQQSTGFTPQVIQELRDEINRLRDTTTQHAMSIQHSMERLERRVEFLEHKTSGSTETVSEPPRPMQQRVGLGGS